MNGRMGNVPSVYDILAEQSLGNIAAAERDYAAADAHFIRALDLADELLSRPDHRYTIRVKRDYGVFLAKAGRRAEAIETLQWVLDAQIAGYGEGHPRVERTRAALRRVRGA